MLIIYRGSRPFFPLLACSVHLGHQTEAAETINSLLKPGWNWRTEPMKVIGTDLAGNTICCLSHGRYGEMYYRALSGVADIFQLDREIIDVDRIVSERAGVRRWEIACLSRFSWSGDYWNDKKSKIVFAIRSYIAGEAGDNR